MRNISLLQYADPTLVEAGCDEAGRGCLAGPVFAAAVILPKDFYHPLLNDSKQLTASQREKLRPIIESNAISWGVAAISPQEIDELNILRASITGMHRALDMLSVRPESILVDGNRFYKYHDIPHTCVVKGDGKYASIAAASILAKVSRDRFMLEKTKEYPQYEFEKHKGYGTKLHYEKIREFGPSPIHRMSFLKKFYGEK